MLKKFTGKLRYMRSPVMHKSILHFKTVELGFVPCKESFFHKIEIVLVSLISSSTLNSLIMVCPTIPAHIIRHHYCLLLGKGMFELDKIYPFCLSIKFVKYHSKFVHKNYFRKVNFNVFLDPILML